MYTRTVWMRGSVSNVWQIIYFLFHLLSFTLFLCFNVYLFRLHSWASIPSLYDIALIVALAVGYVTFYEMGVVMLLLIIILPLFCCVACCCPRRGSVPSWSPTPQALLARLARSQFSPDMHQGMKECIICQLEYSPGDRLVTLDCDERHYFHEECIEEWLKRNGVCPICRKPVSLLARD